MELLQWDDMMSVGNPVIDAQHKQLLTLTNDLIQALESGTAEGDLKTTFEVLLKYAKDHFKHEEKLFSDPSLPEIKQHIKEHEAFVAMLIQLYGDMENNNAETAKRTQVFLMSWIENHLKDTDMKTLRS